MSAEKSGDPLRGRPPPAARLGRPAAACARLGHPGSGLRGAHARGGAGHAAAGGLRGARISPAAATLHSLRAGLPGGHALRRRDPGGHWGDLHSAPAAPGPGAGPAGAEAPAARLHAHRSADHHLLLLAHGDHRHLQGGAGAHSPGPRGHGVRRDRVTRGPELLLHLPGRGHRSHGALYHPHRRHHHRRAAPRELLGSLKTPRPGLLCAPPRAPRARDSRHPRLRLHGASRLASALQFGSSGTPAKPARAGTPPAGAPATRRGLGRPSSQPSSPSASPPRPAPEVSALGLDSGPEAPPPSQAPPTKTNPSPPPGQQAPPSTPAG